LQGTPRTVEAAATTAMPREAGWFAVSCPANADVSTTRVAGRGRRALATWRPADAGADLRAANRARRASRRTVPTFARATGAGPAAMGRRVARRPRVAAICTPIRPIAGRAGARAPAAFSAPKAAARATPTRSAMPVRRVPARLVSASAPAPCARQASDAWPTAIADNRRAELGRELRAHATIRLPQNHR